jgi:hypothetical protein
MSAVSHQTIKLGKGKHSSPEDGACVMELASMLAGERFSDHPQSVCPAIGSFLRAYNDSIDDTRRQDLYAYASKVVGSRSTRAVERARAERLTEWASDLAPRHWKRLLPERLRSIASQRRPPTDAAGTHAVHAIRKHSDQTHAAALELIDQLLAIGTAEETLVAMLYDRDQAPSETTRPLSAA